MKNRKKQMNLVIVLMGLLMLLFTGMTVSAAEEDEVIIDGVKYYLNPESSRPWATACIYDVRGDDLPSELYVRRKIKHNKVKYKVTRFYWDGGEGWEYMDYRLNYDTTWKSNIEIPDKSRSYQACLKKITFAKGVEVYGAAYGYEKLKRVILEDPNNLKQAIYNNCPKLKRIHFPAGLRRDYDFDIKNCPSLKVTIDLKNKRLKMIGNDIYSKDGLALMNVVSGKKEYKVREGVTHISPAAFWGDTTIETIHAGDAEVCTAGLPKLKRVKVNRKGSKQDTLYWLRMEACPSVRRVDLPESIRYIYPFDPIEDNFLLKDDILTPVKHVYLYSTSLKKGDMKKIPAQTTFHVRSKKVKRQLRKFGFKGNIVIEKNM